MQSNSYLSDCKEKVQICLGEMMKDFGWNGTQDRFSYKMIEALKRRRPLVAPDDYFTRHTGAFSLSIAIFRSGEMKLIKAIIGAMIALITLRQEKK